MNTPPFFFSHRRCTRVSSDLSVPGGAALQNRGRWTAGSTQAASFPNRGAFRTEVNEKNAAGRWPEVQAHAPVQFPRKKSVMTNEKRPARRSRRRRFIVGGASDLAWTMREIREFCKSFLADGVDTDRAQPGPTACPEGRVRRVPAVLST